MQVVIVKIFPASVAQELTTNQSTNGSNPFFMQLLSVQINGYTCSGPTFNELNVGFSLKMLIDGE